MISMCNKSACAAAVVILRIWIGFRCEKAQKGARSRKIKELIC